MSDASSLDVRLPIGLLFTVLGMLLGVYGLLGGSIQTDAVVQFPFNVNLWWGLAMLLFGILLLAASARAARRPGEKSASLDESLDEEER